MKTTGVVELSNNPWKCTCASQVTDLVITHASLLLGDFPKLNLFDASTESHQQNRRQERDEMWPRVRLGGERQTGTSSHRKHGTNNSREEIIDIYHLHSRSWCSIRRSSALQSRTARSRNSFWGCCASSSQSSSSRGSQSSPATTGCTAPGGSSPGQLSKCPRIQGRREVGLHVLLSEWERVLHGNIIPHTGSHHHSGGVSKRARGGQLSIGRNTHFMYLRETRDKKFLGGQEESVVGVMEHILTKILIFNQSHYLPILNSLQKYKFMNKMRLSAVTITHELN